MTKWGYATKRSRLLSPSRERQGAYTFVNSRREWSRALKGATKWFSAEAHAYRMSGRMYPTNIFSDDMVVSSTRGERFLCGLDHFAIDKFEPDSIWRKMHPFVGKWVIDVRRDEVDAAWQLVVDEVQTEGSALTGAKVSTRRRNRHVTYRYRPRGQHVILVYTPNFLWRENVREVRTALKRIGFTSRLNYMPNLLTDAPRSAIKPRPNDSTPNYRYYG